MVNFSSSLMLERKSTIGTLFYFFSFCFTFSDCYLILVNEDQRPGDVIFNSSVYKLGSERHYEINAKRSPAFVPKLIHLDSEDGRVTLLDNLQCNSIFYPNLFIAYIDSTSNRLGSIDYYSLPLRIIIVGKDCNLNSDLVQPQNNINDTISNNIFYSPFLPHNSSSINIRIAEERKWVSETYASFPLPSADKWHQICLRQSQFINSITAFLPKTLSQHCNINFLDVNDNRFKIEKSQGDLVASKDVCISEPLWIIVILFNIHCKDVRVLDSEHRLRIVYHHEIFNGTDNVASWAMKNESPFFEQHLYVANVLEEYNPGIVVTTVKAKDRANKQINYSITGLLDSRTQPMFDIDDKTGIVTTKVRLDRELIDVHYFRVTASGHGFPPRSGTTLLQINVLDVNDHSPEFENNEYDESIRANVTLGTTVIILTTTDKDIDKNAQVEYSIKSVSGGRSTAEDKNAFKIDSETGVITTKRILNNETTVKLYTVIVEATDQAVLQNARRSSRYFLNNTYYNFQENYSSLETS